MRWDLVAGMALSLALIALEIASDRRNHRRKAAIVRSELVRRKCRCCGGGFDDWDGRFLPGGVHFNPGGYLPLVVVHCRQCRGEQEFYFQQGVPEAWSLIDPAIFDDHPA